MPKVISLEQLDSIVEHTESLMTSDYRSAMNFLNDITLDITPPHTILADPFSEAYSKWVLETYEKVAGIEGYEASKHEADPNVSDAIPLQNYFPFGTKDTELVGRYIAGVGLIISQLGVPPGSRVVEYGTGWGHVAATLARAGYQVFCVDIEKKFLELAEIQAKSLGCEIKTHYGQFGDRPFAPNDGKADAVIFFEAFHHALNHRDVLRKIRKDVLKPGGYLLLAGEPVHPAFPVPWGIRPDGHALWAIRQHKWMELGFQEDYLLRALLREGFLISRMQIEELGTFGLIYRGELHQGKVRLGETLLPTSEAVSWAAPPPGGEPRRFALVDSRATLDHAAWYGSVAVSLANYLPIPLEVALDAGANSAIRRRLLPREREEVLLPLPEKGRELRIWSQTGNPYQLGMSDDARDLGVSVEELTYRGK